MLVRVAGDNIMLCPPFIMTHEELDMVILLLSSAIRSEFMNLTIVYRMTLAVLNSLYFSVDRHLW